MCDNLKLISNTRTVWDGYRITRIPPLKIQKQIVAQIEKEQKLVEANRKLIEIFEGKIEAKIAEVWGEEK